MPVEEVSWLSSHDTRAEFIIHSKPGFLMSRKSQTIGDFTVSRPSLILPTNENSKSKIFPIVRDGQGQFWRIGSVLFSRYVTDFCDGRRSFPTNENSNLYRRERLRWISLITNPLNCWAPAPLSQINMASLDNLGQTSGDYPMYLEWSAKTNIPDRLGFSWHMKTRL